MMFFVCSEQPVVPRQWLVLSSLFGNQQDFWDILLEHLALFVTPL